MDRRAFLRLLGMGAAGATLGAELDLERLLWVPKPIITVPAMPLTLTEAQARVIARTRNTLVSPDVLTREWLRIMQANMKISEYVNRRYDEAANGHVRLRIKEPRWPS